MTDNLEPYSRDFGNSRRETPLAVVIPTCTEDIVKTFTLARNNGITIKIRGAGHTNAGQTLCDGGIVLVNDGRRRLERRDKGIVSGRDDTVDVPSYFSWLDVTTELRKQGRLFPVMPNYLNLSVGGTLSTGGYSYYSLRYGRQSDYVQKLRLLKPDGTLEWLAREDELFLYSLAGLGQVGLIDTVSLSTVDYKRFTRLHGFHCEDLDAVVEAVEHLRDNYSHGGHSPDCFVAMKSQSVPAGGPWSVQLASDYANEEEAQSHDDDIPCHFYERFPNHTVQTVPDYALAVHAEMVKQVRALKNYRMVWVDHVFDFDGFCRFAAFVKGSIIEERKREVQNSIPYLSQVRQSSLVATGKPWWRSWRRWTR